jgi:hypothetical protein
LPRGGGDEKLSPDGEFPVDISISERMMNIMLGDYSILLPHGWTDLNEHEDPTEIRT